MTCLTGPGGGVELVSPSQRLFELRTVFHEGPMKENAWQLDVRREETQRRSRRKRERERYRRHR